MSRKPINVEFKGLQTPRERMWDAILKLKRFTAMSLQDTALPLVGLDAVQDYMLELTRAGYLKKLTEQGRNARAKFAEVYFELVKQQGSAPRVNLAGTKVTQGVANEAMWRAMKVLKTFDYKDIANAASLGDLKVKPQTAKSYVVLLARAGYMATVRPSRAGAPARHQLIKNTGPQAPAITRLKVVFDRNTGQFAHLETAQEVCDALE